jgi:hypothetical protein
MKCFPAWQPRGRGDVYVAFARPALLALAASPAGAETTTAEAALKRYREHFQTIDAMDCPRGEDIVVCGRRKAELKSLPYTPEPGGHVRLLPGEPPGAGFAPLCTWDCVEPPKGGIRNIVKGIGHLLGKDD